MTSHEIGGADWLREEIQRARRRRATLPRWARPRLLRGSPLSALFDPPELPPPDHLGEATA